MIGVDKALATACHSSCAMPMYFTRAYHTLVVFLVPEGNVNLDACNDRY